MAQGVWTAVRSQLPYRIDLSSPPAEALDVLVELGALDVEAVGGGLAAILPDAVTPDRAAAHFPAAGMRVSAAVGRDSGSVWRVSAGAATLPGGLRLIDSEAFGTGHHPSTALCLEALLETIHMERPDRILDVGTGSGILALVALRMGVTRATGVDIDAGALTAAAENARTNGLADRLELFLGGPDAVEGQWPVVAANLLAAPLIDMAPALVRRLGSRGQLILSGIHSSLEAEVRRAYLHLGVRGMGSKSRGGWAVVTGRAPW